ncbi:MAG: anhydro-N-acetylmuramic acid kinase, partial [Candidatus Latescibacterota bacterium]
GTSADGIDAVLVELRGSGSGIGYDVLAFETVPLPAEMRPRVLRLCGAEALVEELCEVNFVLGELFARAALTVIEAAGMTTDQVDLVGSHGQTVRHLPWGSPPSTLQIGEPAIIAARTGIVTVADFRPADMAWQGQGAPLVPLVDRLLFSSAEIGRVILNIGGIANITVLPASASAEEVVAFDTGPGNMLIDGAVARFTDGAERYDRDGIRAAQGQVDEDLLSWLLSHPYLDRRPPKSTGREEFGQEFLERVLVRWAGRDEDLMATLTAFTARTVAESITAFADRGIHEVWIAGGGVHNRQLMTLLRQALPGMAVESLAGLGVDPDAREALTFAVLANETLMDRPGNLPSATGARRPAVLGKIVLP